MVPSGAENLEQNTINLHCDIFKAVPTQDHLQENNSKHFSLDFLNIFVFTFFFSAVLLKVHLQVFSL